MGVNKEVNIPTRGQISPLGARGEVKNGPPNLRSSSWQFSLVATTLSSKLKPRKQ
jgi:hypothetical protein